jgi:predicted esterase YcpF (UPF0227 family)
MIDHNQYTIIYLHGFLSSPQSVKAMQTQSFFAEQYPEVEFVVPYISHYPDKAVEQLKALVEQYNHTQLRFIGSSMGGFFSTYLVSQFDGKAVLINPAVMPHILLKEYLGEHENPYTKDVFLLEDKHIEILRELYVDPFTASDRFWVLLQTGDETLDYRQAEQRYREAKVTVEQGGDHSFIGYEKYLSDIAKFLFTE